MKMNKFSDRDVAFIRKRAKNSRGCPEFSLAEYFSCTTNEIVNIINGNWYKDVDENKTYRAYCITAINTWTLNSAKRIIRVDYKTIGDKVPYVCHQDTIRYVCGEDRIDFDNLRTGRTFNTREEALKEIELIKKYNKKSMFKNSFVQITIEEIN